MLPVDLPPAPPAAERLVLHQSRAVHDGAALRYADLAAGPTSRWVVALLEPGKGSGSATIPGASLQGGSGGLSLPPGGAKAVVQKKGRWKRQAVQGTEWPAEGAYAWNEPMDPPARTLTPEDLYSPFVDGGLIFFRPVPGESGLAQFGTVHLLFREWGAYLPQAMSYAQKLGTPPDALPDADALLRMISSENPVLTLVGLKELVGLRPLAAAEVRTPLERARGPLRAALVYVLLARATLAADEQSELAAVADRAAGPDTLVPLAGGALAVLQFHASQPTIAQRARTLLLQLRQRATKLGAPTATDEQLLVIWRFAGLSA